MANGMGPEDCSVLRSLGMGSRQWCLSTSCADWSQAPEAEGVLVG